MNLKLTLALLVVAAALGGGVYWQNQQKASATPTPFALQGQIFGDVRTGQVSQIEVRLGGQVGSAQKTDDGTWRLTQPTSDFVDNAKVDSLVSSLVTIRATRTLTNSATPANLPQYGLDQPELIVQAQGQEISPISLSIGREAPAGSARYARRPDTNDVYLVSSSVVSDLIKLVTDPPRATPTATSTPAPTATATPPPG